MGEVRMTSAGLSREEQDELDDEICDEREADQPGSDPELPPATILFLELLLEFGKLRFENRQSFAASVVLLSPLLQLDDGGFQYCLALTEFDQFRGVYLETDRTP